MEWLYIVAGLLVVIVLVVIFTYNGLIKLNERVNEALSDITVQLKYRADLIPNLIETVKGYAAHEKEVFENVTRARSELLAVNKNVKNVSLAEEHATKALAGLFAIAESYPELKANESFVKFQGQLEEIESKIQAARRFYNIGVQEFNVKLKVFPTKIYAKGLGFSEKEFFEVSAEEREKIEKVPEVKF